MKGRSWKPIRVLLLVLCAFLLVFQPAVAAAAPSIGAFLATQFPARPPQQATPQPAPQFTSDGPAVTSRITASQGGTVQSADGKIRVVVPAGATSDDVDVTFTPLKRWVWGAPNMRVVNMFRLEAARVSGGAAVTTFTRELDVTFDLSQNYNTNELAGLDLGSLGLYFFDAATERWERLPSSVQAPSRGAPPRLTAKTTHFSVFGNQAAPVIAGPGAVLGFQNDLHSGAAVASIPIEVPPGPGGFAPKLNLNYNSGSVDEMKNKRELGSWVGIGWSLSVGSISKNLETGTYYLSLNGASYELVLDTQTSSWRTKQESGFAVSGVDGQTWTVRDRNGTLYTFGGTAGSKPYYKDWIYVPPEDCVEGSPTYYRYDLNEVQDSHGNQMTVSYVWDTVDQSATCARFDVVSAYPSQVSYGKNINDATTSNRFTVTFNSSSDNLVTNNGWVRNDNPLGGSPYSYARVRENKRLTSIEVKVDTTLVRKYVFTYNTTNAGTPSPFPAGQMTLTSFQQVGADGASTLPAMSFSYSTPTTYFYNSGQGTTSDPCNPCNPAQFTWPHLQTITNGYGATVTYSYTSIPTPNTSNPNIWVRAAVTQRDTNPGIGPTQTLTYTYTGNPAYFVPNSSNHWLDEYRGFGTVDETDAAGNFSRHNYFTTGDAASDKMTGKEWATYWYNPGATVLYRQRQASWNWAWCCVYGPSPFTNSQKSWWVYLEQEDVTAGVVGTNKTARTRYTYDLPSTSTGNIGYGNLIRENRDGDTGVTGDESTVFYDYNRNTSFTVNILDTVKSAKVYTGNLSSESGTAAAFTETFYDGNNSNHSTAPTKGEVTRVQRYTTVSSASVSDYFTYDAFGNKLTHRSPNGTTDTTTWTHWAYDSTFHSLPVTETYPAIGGSSMSESATWNFGAGKMLSWTDVNGQTTSYEYDTFWRQTKAIRPGDTSGSPTVKYNYNSWGTINSQNLQTCQKVSSTDPCDDLWSKQYFDGVGRVVQAHQKGETEGATTFTIIGGATAYSSRGLVDKAYVGQKLDASTVSGYTTPGGGWKFTQYAYDGIGRVTTQTNPDGTTVGHSYTDWKDDVTNERGYHKVATADAFGRLAKVEEKDASNSLYATTNYTYHQALGALTAVEDNASNDTTMSYDALGRKTSMTDPDMGTWDYKYDANGNLTAQRDAKSQVLFFTYDVLNRMTQKCDSGSWTTPACTTRLAAYSYDSVAGGNVGKGRRTGMTDAPGTDSYTYDSRGRLTKEDRVLDSTTYTTQYTYDSADRQTTVTYPTSEVVTNTYNGRGLPSSVSGSVVGTVASGALYNQLGQLTQVNLGNGLQTVYNYHGLDGVDSGDADNSYEWGRLYRIKTTKVSDSSVRLHWKHWWDAGGNLASRTDAVASSTESFTYDFLDRLTAVSGAYSASYSYNTIGNLLTFQGNTYTYGASSPSHPHAVTANTNGYNYTYDANGSMTAKGSSTFTWDTENRLTAVGSDAYTYDGDGARMKKVEGGVTLVYPNRYYAKNVTAGQVFVNYHLGGMRVAFKVGSDLVYVHNDHLGGPVVNTDSAGATRGSEKFYPFGYQRATTGSPATDQRQFNGEIVDDTNLQYLGARSYDVTLGRFVSADSIVPNMANPQSLNRYSYVLNNPLRYTDPTGHTLSAATIETAMDIVRCGSGCEISDGNFDWAMGVISGINPTGPTAPITTGAQTSSVPVQNAAPVQVDREPPGIPPPVQAGGTPPPGPGIGEDTVGSDVGPGQDGSRAHGHFDPLLTPIETAEAAVPALVGLWSAGVLFTAYPPLVAAGPVGWAVLGLIVIPTQVVVAGGGVFASYVIESQAILPQWQAAGYCGCW